MHPHIWAVYLEAAVCGAVAALATAGEAWDDTGRRKRGRDESCRVQFMSGPATAALLQSGTGQDEPIITRYFQSPNLESTWAYLLTHSQHHETVVSSPPHTF